MKHSEVKRAYKAFSVEIAQPSVKPERNILRGKPLPFCGIFFIQLSVAVLLVAEHGATYKRHVRAYLVGSARMKIDFNERGVAALLLYRVLGNRRQRARPRRGIDLDLIPLLYKVRGQLRAFLPERVFADSVISFMNFPLSERRQQLPLGEFVFRVDDKPLRVSVEAVHGVEFALAAKLAKKPLARNARKLVRDIDVFVLVNRIVRGFFLLL